jgi:hypothetical protein
VDQATNDEEENESGLKVSEADTEEGKADADEDKAMGDQVDIEEDKANTKEAETNADGNEQDAEESEAALLQKKDAASAAGCPMGSHIEVQWGKKWYPGVVTNFDLDSREHYVVYDDGEDEQYEDLQATEFRFLEEEGEEEVFVVQAVIDEKMNKVCA